MFVDNHKVWTIHSVAYDNSVQAGRSTMARYEFQIPQNVHGPVQVTARVNYRHLRQSYINNVLGKDHPAYPIVQLAARTRTLNLGDNPPEAADPLDNPDWMRWNNLGIAYLDQLQYSEAINAFAHVVKLRPDYADGFTNIGLTDIEWEKYESARGSLEKALELAPNNARALYYLALVERRAGHSEAEVADLRKVIAQFPQSRDARRELGISYYNLALLYRRMGMKDKAKEQTAMFVTKKVDPGAPTYSLDFLRKHPEISIESSPWHVHTDMPHTDDGEINSSISHTYAGWLQ
jgi:tetratricopeptide (TPR) repeat protein